MTCNAQIIANPISPTMPPVIKTATAGMIAAISLFSVNANSIKTIDFKSTPNAFEQPFATGSSIFSWYHYGDLNFYIAGTPAMREDLHNNLIRISEISELEDNWNGNGAVPFSAELIEKAKAIVYGLVHQPSIFPTACKSIQLEFNNSLGDYLELELFEDGRNREFLYHPDGSYTEKLVSEDDIFTVVEEFYGS